MCEFYVYILKSKINNKSYVGQTDNLERRFREHNSGKSNFTAKFVPWEIVFTEKISSRNEALKREKYFTSSAGRRFIKKIFE